MKNRIKKPPDEKHQTAFENGRLAFLFLCCGNYKQQNDYDCGDSQQTNYNRNHVVVTGIWIFYCECNWSQSEKGYCKSRKKSQKTIDCAAHEKHILSIKEL